ncbi:hypothetical protein EAH68_12765 [Corynebacterium hylobatis]|uniref:Terminase n=1 Tax=Corynebacterium hylobatis TaxID=1859290 RepID=A0A430HVB6_9CORY|nr:hypothetical protein [Corynebacterium hylobatis]RSZ61529.1 hypothetical protein EAH68_12765 [Corynebacterium hylobatis]
MAGQHLIGQQQPRLSSIPEGDPARGKLAVDFVHTYGVNLFPWQDELLIDMCRDTVREVEHPGGTTVDEVVPAVSEVVVPLARQNGKGELLIASELSGVYLFKEKTILHTAHLMDTAQDAQKRLWDVISENDDLMTWWEDDYDGVPEITTGNGKESIKFPNGAVIYFRTRTEKTGRGLPVDRLIFDECFNLPQEIYAAMNYTTRARPRAQKIFISSPVNRRRHRHGKIFSAKRWAGIDGAPKTLFKEWSPGKGDDPHALDTWIKTNPSLTRWGAGVQLDEVQNDSNSAKNDDALLEVFLVEALGQGDWYPRAGDVEKRDHVIDLSALAAAARTVLPAKTGDSCIAADTPPGGDGVAVWSAFRTSYGAHLYRAPIEEMDTDQVTALITGTARSADPVAVVYDPKTALSVITPRLTAAGIEPVRAGAQALTTAASTIVARMKEGTVTWDGSSQLTEAVEAADWRHIGEVGRAFTRKTGVIHDLVAASLALWGLETFEIPDYVPEPEPEPMHIPAPLVVEAPATLRR